MSEAKIDLLNAEIARLNAEGKTRRFENKRLRSELETANGQITSLTADRDSYKQKLESSPGELQAEVDRLQGELLSRDHRDAFKSVPEFSVKGSDGTESKYTLNDGVNVDALWDAIKYKPEGDKPDEAKITGLYQQTVASKPYLFKSQDVKSTPEPGGSPTAIKTAAERPGPGASRSNLSASDKVTALGVIGASNGNRPVGRIA